MKKLIGWSAASLMAFAVVGCEPEPMREPVPQREPTMERSPADRPPAEQPSGGVDPQRDPARPQPGTSPPPSPAPAR